MGTSPNSRTYMYLAEREGFEPPVPFGITGFQDQRHQPLGHLSIKEPAEISIPEHRTKVNGENGPAEHFMEGAWPQSATRTFAHPWQMVISHNGPRPRRCVNTAARKRPNTTPSPFGATTRSPITGCGAACATNSTTDAIPPVWRKALALPAQHQTPQLGGNCDRRAVGF